MNGQLPATSPWIAPPFLLTACLTLVGLGSTWGVLTARMDAGEDRRIEDRAALHQCVTDQAALRLRVATLESEGAGQQRLWIEKWNTIDARSQRIEAMLEELLRGRAARPASYR